MSAAPTLELQTAGLSKGRMVTMHVGIWACGEIADGVSVSLPFDGALGAGWVLAFADLERAYLAAKAYRTEEHYRLTREQRAAAGVLPHDPYLKIGGAV